METEFNIDEFVHAYPDGIENNYWNKARNKIILDAVRKLPAGQIIDVGAGRGVVTGYLFRNGIAIQGVELGKTTPVSNLSAPVLYDTNVLSLNKQEAAAFTAVSFFDVIEHIEKPVQFMKEIVSHFENVEYLVITVPARKELWTNFDDYYGHFKRYDPETLHDEIRQLGFEMMECRYFFHLLYLLIRLNNLVSKKREIQFDAPRGISKLIHSCMAWIFYIEKYFIPSKWYGSSIIGVARRITK